MRHLPSKRPIGVLVLTAIVVVVGSVGVGAAQQPSNGKLSSVARSSRHRHHAGRRGPTGPQGPQGVPGPRGERGEPGAPGAAIPLIYKASQGTATAPIFEWGGLLIKASCGPPITLTGVSEAPGSMYRVVFAGHHDGTNEELTHVLAAWNNSTSNKEFPLALPPSYSGNFTLTYLAANGSSIITANYSYAENGMALVNVYCAVFGTIQTANG